MTGYFAAEGQIARTPIEGGIEITAQQYRDALDGMLEGKEVTIDGGFAMLDPPAPTEPEPEPEPVDPDAVPLELKRCASVRLEIDGFDITGFERSQGVGMAFMLDPETAWVFFESPQADSSYIVMPEEGVTKYPDYIEVVLAGRSSLSLIIFRVE